MATGSSSQSADKTTEKVGDSTKLPCPIPYEEIHREALSKLHPGNGVRFFFYIPDNADTGTRQSRIRGKIDSNACIATYLEERLNPGLNFILSAEIDHKKKDYKFGFGLGVGE